jgi:ferritin
MMVQYLLDAGALAPIPGVAPPHNLFGDVVEPVALALEQERRVTDQINALAAIARQEGDYSSEQFMQWFIKEQIEEVASMNDLLKVVTRSRDNPLLAEEYLAREATADEGADPTAPPVAGGPL